MLVDANLLIYARVKTSPEHSAARGWLEEKLNASAAVGTAMAEPARLRPAGDESAGLRAAGNDGRRLEAGGGVARLQDRVDPASNRPTSPDS